MPAWDGSVMLCLFCSTYVLADCLPLGVPAQCASHMLAYELVGCGGSGEAMESGACLLRPSNFTSIPHFRPGGPTCYVRPLFSVLCSGASSQLHKSCNTKSVSKGPEILTDIWWVGAQHHDSEHSRSLRARRKARHRERMAQVLIG
eukprot:1150349-Pelagomonas_calceolata.AAC.2